MISVTLILLMILMSGRLIQQLTAAAAGEVSLEIVFFTLLLRLPSFLEMILPLALFISILLVYGRLYAESEMTVLAATGVSDNKLLGYTLIPGLIVTIVVGSFSLYLSPLGAQKMEDLYRKQAELTEFELLVPGRFQSTQKGERVTYTESLSGDKTRMFDVFIADGNTLLLAEEGTQHVSPETGSRFLELSKGKRFDLTDNSLEFSALEFEDYGVKIADELEERKQLRKEAVSTLDLIGSNNNKHKGQLYWRFSLILMVPILVLIAFPLSRVNPRQGRFARVFPAIVLFMVYISLIIAFKGMIEKGKDNTVLMLMGLHLLYLLIGSFLVMSPALSRYIKKKKAASSLNEGAA